MTYRIENPSRGTANARKWRAKQTPEKLEQLRHKQREARASLSPEERRRRNHAHAVKKKYGLTPEQYAEVVARPCGICGTTAIERVADHDHATGEIRGALCPKHNHAIGMLGDTAEGVMAALRYLNGAPL